MELSLRNEEKKIVSWMFILVIFVMFSVMSLPFQAKPNIQTMVMTNNKIYTKQLGMKYPVSDKSSSFILKAAGALWSTRILNEIGYDVTNVVTESMNTVPIVQHPVSEESEQRMLVTPIALKEQEESFAEIPPVIKEIESDYDDVQESNFDISGFVIDASGNVIDTSTDMYDGVLLLPMDSRCRGVERFEHPEILDEVMELYIPDNIEYINPEALNVLGNLIHITVSENNSNYYSENGLLYLADGTLICVPYGRSHFGEHWDEE